MISRICMVVLVLLQFSKADDYSWTNFTAEEISWHSALLKKTLVGSLGYEGYSCILSSRRCCSCTPACYRFRDCCIDVAFSRRPMPPDEYIAVFQQQIREHALEECLPILKGLPGEHFIESLMQVSSCPTTDTGGSNNLVINQLCIANQSHYSEIKSITPTLVLGRNGIFYGNKYCAQCNREENYENVDIAAIDCVLEDEKAVTTNISLENLRNCEFMLVMDTDGCPQPPQVVRPDYRSDWRMYADNCTTQEFELCLSYLQPLSDLPEQAYASQFANVYCLKCLLNSSIALSATCSYEEASARYKTWQSKGYSMLLAFNKGVLGKTEIKKPCGNLQKYDVLQSKCLPSRCTPPYVIKEGECKIDHLKVSENAKKENFSGYDISDSIDWKNEFTRCALLAGANVYSHSRVASKAFLDFIQSYGLSSSNMSVSYFNSTSLQGMKLSGNFDLNKTSAIFERKLDTFPWSSVDEVVLSPLDISSSILYGDKWDYQFPGQRWCAEPNDISLYFNLSYLCRIKLYKEGNFSQRSLELNASLLSKNISFRIVANINKTFYKVIYCSRFHLQPDCLLHIHGHGKYEILSNLSALTSDEKSTTNLLQPEEYVPLSNGIGTCTKESSMDDKDGWKKSIDEATTVLSTIGGVLSVCSLVITIAIYICCKPLRTVPGKNMLSLCVAILGSDVLIITWIHGGIVGDSCRIVGIFIHWFLLSQHMWCLIIAINFAQTFAFHELQFRQYHRMHFFLCSIITWGLSALTVSICVLIDSLTEGAFMYGKDGFCWIYSERGRLGAYIVPALGILGFNAIITIFVVIHLCKSRHNASTVLKSNRNQSDVALLKVAIKMCFLLGLLDVFGAVQLNDHRESLEKLSFSFNLIYSVLRSSRGFFIFLCFTTQQRVLAITKELLRSNVQSLFRNKKDISRNERSNAHFVKLRSVPLQNPILKFKGQS